MTEACLATARRFDRAPSGATAVTRLRLRQFRCYAEAALDTGPEPVVLTGPNGAGKTNLLEALSLLAPGRGLRRARLSEMDRRDGGGTGWTVAATVAGPAGAVDIGCGRDMADRSDRRIVRIDGQPAKGQAALAEHVAAIWLTPQMDRLFLEGPAGRRRFLDRLVFGFDPAHAGRVGAYEHALRERARLLRPETGGPRPDDSWLEALERSMAERGIAIAAARREMTARLRRACAAGSDAFPVPDLAVAGAVEDWLDQGPAVEAETRFMAALAESRPRDALTGGAAVGPHRSDFVVRDRTKDMPAEQCSTGEQKALLIAIVLADARLVAAERGTAPLLLLDEVAAHLDADRRDALFDAVTGVGAQAWLTGTDDRIFAPLAHGARFFRVEQAQIRPAAPPA
ncbi:MAG: DNA replication/repair protein RecF [Alphaproteobacteria bacterium]